MDPTWGAVLAQPGSYVPPDGAGARGPIGGIWDGTPVDEPPNDRDGSTVAWCGIRDGTAVIAWKAER